MTNTTPPGPTMSKLVPLTEMMERLRRQGAEVSAAAAMWQARAIGLEDRVHRLGALAAAIQETEIDDPVLPLRFGTDRTPHGARRSRA